MIKTIKLDKDHELTLSNNAGWLYEYRDQFGHDITPDIMPLISAIMRVITEVAPHINDTDDIFKLIKTTPPELFQEAIFELAGWQVTDLINIVWALAKCADDEIEEPRKWIRQFDAFPFDIIVPEVWDMVLKGFITSKNLKALNGVGAKVKKLTSTKSPLPQSKEA